MKTRKMKSWTKQCFTGYQIYFNYVTSRCTRFLLHVKRQLNRLITLWLLLYFMELDLSMTLKIFLSKAKIHYYVW